MISTAKGEMGKLSTAPCDTPQVSAREKHRAEWPFASCGHNSHPVIIFGPPSMTFRHVWIGLGIRWESIRNPLGIRSESVRNPLGIHQESVGNPLGIR